MDILANTGSSEEREAATRLHRASLIVLDEIPTLEPDTDGKEHQEAAAAAAPAADIDQSGAGGDNRGTSPKAVLEIPFLWFAASFDGQLLHPTSSPS